MNRVTPCGKSVNDIEVIERMSQPEIWPMQGSHFTADRATSSARCTAYDKYSETLAFSNCNSGGPTVAVLQQPAKPFTSLDGW